MPGPQPAAREHDRAPRQDDPPDTDTGPGEQQPQEERDQRELQVGYERPCVSRYLNVDIEFTREILANAICS